MEEKILAIRLKKNGKLLYCTPLKYTFKIGDMVIVNTDRGNELARVVKILERKDLPENVEISDIVRPAGKKDIQLQKQNEIKAKEALEFCKTKIKELGLDMKLLAAEYVFDGSKIIFYFTSESRVDFRELVKVLASSYKSRIELRQVGPRDEVKIYPNLGVCGREVCCRCFLKEFEPVTIKMAKEQGLQINMTKLSGACGKLKCCLRYEEDVYKENLIKLPKIGEIVRVDGEEEKAKVISLDVLNLKVKVKFGTTHEDERVEMYPVDKINFKSRNDTAKNANSTQDEVVGGE